nr:MAG TPA: hypothetical protein [Caudoviricetes sp.]
MSGLKNMFSSSLEIIFLNIFKNEIYVLLT